MCFVFARNSQDNFFKCIYIYYEGTWRRSCFESVKRVHFPEPQDAMLTSCSLAACRLYNAYVRKLSCMHLGRCVVQRQERTYHPHKSTYDPSRPHLRPSNPLARSAPTTLTAQPTTLQDHTYDPQTSMHARSAPTTLTAQPTTLQGHTYDPQTRMSGAHLRPSQLNLRPFKATPTTLKPACQEVTTTLCALWPNTKVLAKAREKEERLKASNTPPTVARQVLALYGVHIAKAHST